jgi:hypothetical protein
MPHAVPKRVEPANASCRPINKISPDVLFQVFDFVLGLGPILPLAQVCRRWPDVASACARLVPLFLQGSLGSPLPVRGMAAYHDNREFLTRLPTAPGAHKAPRRLL